MQEIEEQGWTVPDYYFVAEYGGVESEDSKVLNVKGFNEKGIKWVRGHNVTDQQWDDIKSEANRLMNSGTEAGRRFSELDNNTKILVTINIVTNDRTRVQHIDPESAGNGKGSDTSVSININNIDSGPGVMPDLGVTLAHEVSGHAYLNYLGKNPRYLTFPDVSVRDRFIEEKNVVAMENEYRSHKGLEQRLIYSDVWDNSRDEPWDMPIYNDEQNAWYIYDYFFENNFRYRRLEGDRVRWYPIGLSS
jgi:hypothetical protein